MSDNSKVILITGTSSGIGKACAEYLTKQGYTVYGTSRYPGSYTKPDDYTILQMDVTDETTIANAITKIIETEGHLEVVINNAGYGIAGIIEDTSIDKGQEQIDNLFFGTARVIKKVLPIMKNKNSGLIINISSIGGLIGLLYEAYYSAAKFAFDGFTEAVYKELYSSNICTVLI